MAVENIRGAIEAILFANGASVEFSRIAQALEISEKKVKEHISALIDDYEKLQKKGKVPSQIDCKQLRHLLGNTNPIEFDFVMDMHDNLDLYLDYDINIESIVLNDKTLAASLDMFNKITCDNIRTMFKMIQSGFVSDVERKTIEFLIDYKTAEGNIQ